MSEFNITVPGGESKRLKTGGKYCPADIVVTAEGRAEVVEKDVNFYDYDGILLYSYTLEEAQALTELPPAPTPPREFLVFSRWNWSLAQVKALTYKMNVGAVYDTVDGGVYAVLDIRYNTQLTIPLVFNLYANCAAEIDWGDGSEVERVEKVSTLTTHRTSHTYPALGEYVLRLSATGTTFVIGGNNYTDTFFESGAKTPAKVALKEIYIGNKCERVGHVGLGNFTGLKKITMHYGLVAGESAIGGSALVAAVAPKNLHYAQFNNDPALRIVCVSGDATSIPAYSLANSSPEKVCLPDSISTLGNNCLNNSTALGEIRVPSAVTSIPASFCNGSKMLTSVSLHDGITTINAHAFYVCESLPEVTIPASVTTIGGYAFQGCVALRVVRFLANTPPVLQADAASSVFSGVPADCVYEVPAASLEAYKSATNYGSIATQMIGA